jgi:hypothetical protein
LPGWCGPQSSHFKFPAISGMTGGHHHTQLFFLLRWGLMNFFSLSWGGRERTRSSSTHCWGPGLQSPRSPLRVPCAHASVHLPGKGLWSDLPHGPQGQPLLTSPTPLPRENSTHVCTLAHAHPVHARVHASQTQAHTAPLNPWPFAVTLPSHTDHGKAGTACTVAGGSGLTPEVGTEIQFP